MMDTNVKIAVDQLIQRLDSHKASQSLIDEQFANICRVINAEMDTVLESRTVKVTGVCNFVKKPWWNDKLSAMWNSARAAEKCWVK